MRLIDLMTAAQKKAFDTGQIKLDVTAEGLIVATEGARRGVGRTPRMAIEAMV
jgi:hypothetical protein